MTGKNSADIRLAVDAMDLAWSKEHIDTFVIVSGDSDFSPLVSKLKENGKHIIGIGMKESTSNLLADNCDEFIFYEDLEKVPPALAPGPGRTVDIPKAKREVFDLLIESVAALIRENKNPIFASMVKDTMQRKRPAFNESGYGYRSFSELLEDAEKRGFLDPAAGPQGRRHLRGGGFRHHVACTTAAYESRSALRWRNSSRSMSPRAYRSSRMRSASELPLVAVSPARRPGRPAAACLRRSRSCRRTTPT